MQESFIFTISATEDKTILSRILQLFTRRNIAFQNLVASRPDEKANYHYRIEARTSRHWAEQINKELRRIIGVAYVAVLEKKGETSSTHALLEALQPYGVQELTKPEAMTMAG